MISIFYITEMLVALSSFKPFIYYSSSQQVNKIYEMFCIYNNYDHHLDEVNRLRSIGLPPDL